MREIFFILLVFATFSTSAKIPLENSRQLMVVVTENWRAHKGKINRFERESINAKWRKISNTKPVVVGKNGLGWGKGLHSAPSIPGPIKKEGDLKAPAGIFSLGASFGHTNSKYIKNKLSYIEITPTTEAIDDPNSVYYNQILRRELISNPDWISSEKMGLISLYLRGIIINHNTIDIDRKLGSQIFMHIWRSSKDGTAGCTALSPESMNEIFNWLDSNKHPLLVQLPRSVLRKVSKDWGLPIHN